MIFLYLFSISFSFQRTAFTKTTNTYARAITMQMAHFRLHISITADWRPSAYVKSSVNYNNEFMKPRHSITPVQ